MSIRARSRFRASSGNGGSGNAPFNPATSIPPGQRVAWYDSSDASTITQVGGLVSQQNDKWGTNHRTQGVGARQPSINTATINSLPVLRAATSQGMVYPAGVYSISSGNFTIYKVMRSLDVVTTNIKLIGLGSDGALARTNFGYNVSGNTDTASYVAGASPAKVAAYKCTQDTNAHMMVMGVKDGTTAYIAQDGDVGGVGTGYIPYTMTTFSMENGGTAHTTTDHGEEFIISGTLSATLDAQIKAYLKAKWATPNAFSAPTSTLRTAATQNRLMTGQQAVASTDSFYFNVPKRVPITFSSFVVSLNQWYRGVAAETNITGSYTIQEMAIYNNAGTLIGNVLFSGGATKVVNSGDNDIQSDALTGTFPAGTYWIKGRGTMTAGANIGFTAQLASDVTDTQFGVYAAASTTPSAMAFGVYTFTGTAPTTQTRGFAPILLGVPSSDIGPYWGVTGDSIAEYVNDSAASIDGDGWFQRMVGANNYPSLNLAQNGTASTLYTSGQKWRSYIKYLGATKAYVVDEVGTNDIGAGAQISATAVTELQNRLKNIWATLKQYGVNKVIRSKYTPRTSGTIGSQTPLANYSSGSTTDIMATFFDSSVSGGLIDATFDFSSIRDPGNLYIWKSTPITSTDLLHPIAAGEALMATDFNNAAISAGMT